MKTLVEAFVERCRERGLDDGQIKEAAIKASSLDPEIHAEFKQAGLLDPIRHGAEKIQKLEDSHPVVSALARTGAMAAGMHSNPIVASIGNAANAVIGGVRGSADAITGNVPGAVNNLANAGIPYALKNHPNSRMIAQMFTPVAGEIAGNALNKQGLAATDDATLPPALEDIFSSASQHAVSPLSLSMRAGGGALTGATIASLLGANKTHAAGAGAGAGAGTAVGGIVGGPLGTLGGRGLAALMGIKNPAAIARLVNAGHNVGGTLGTVAGGIGGGILGNNLAANIEPEDKQAADASPPGLMGTIGSGLESTGVGLGNDLRSLGKTTYTKPVLNDGIIASIRRALGKGMMHSSVAARKYPRTAGGLLLGGAAGVGLLGAHAIGSMFSSDEKKAFISEMPAGLNDVTHMTEKPKVVSEPKEHAYHSPVGKPSDKWGRELTNAKHGIGLAALLGIPTLAAGGYGLSKLYNNNDTHIDTARYDAELMQKRKAEQDLTERQQVSDLASRQHNLQQALATNQALL